MRAGGGATIKKKEGDEDEEVEVEASENMRVSLTRPCPIRLVFLVTDEMQMSVPASLSSISRTPFFVRGSGTDPFLFHLPRCTFFLVFIPFVIPSFRLSSDPLTSILHPGLCQTRGRKKFQDKNNVDARRRRLS